jgi:hypothetical protein
MSRYLPNRLPAASAFTVALALAPAAVAAQSPRIERLAEIGCADCGDARQLASTWDIAVAESGDVLLVDRDAPTLRLFDRAGRVVWSRGRPGAGPGEYRFPMRAAFGPNGTVQVVDMRLRRLTRLTRDGSVAQSLTIPFFPAGVGARGRQGELVFLTDDFKGGGTLQRWLPTADAPAPIASFPTPPPSEATLSASVAVAPNGDVAFLPSAEKYEIRRLTAGGLPLPAIGRNIPRPRRTPEEIAAMKQRLNMVGATAKETQERKQSGGSKSLLSDDDRFAFKPHASTDALRYDDGGRLWVRTLRGTERATVFDIFAPSGGFVGEVTVPAAVNGYSLAGAYLATASEREDGIPVVVLWAVR